MSDDVTTRPEGGADPSDVPALQQGAAKRRRQVRALESTVAERDDTIAALQARVDTLRELAPGDPDPTPDQLANSARGWNDGQRPTLRIFEAATIPRRTPT